jgi:hypothetical protein
VRGRPSAGRGQQPSGVLADGVEQQVAALDDVELDERVVDQRLQRGPVGQRERDLGREPPVHHRQRGQRHPRGFADELGAPVQ